MKCASILASLVVMITHSKKKQNLTKEKKRVIQILLHVEGTLPFLATGSIFLQITLIIYFYKNKRQAEPQRPAVNTFTLHT